MNDIVKTLVENPVLLRDYGQIQEAILVARRQLKMEYLEEIKKELNDSGYQVEFLQRCPGDPAQWGRTELLVSKMGSFQVGQPFEIWIEFNEEWKAAYIGIERTFKKKIAEDISIRLDEMQKRFRKEFPGSTTEPTSTFGGNFWCCRSNFFWSEEKESSWNSFYADLATTSARKTKVLDAKQKTDAWFLFMEKLWKEAGATFSRT